MRKEKIADTNQNKERKHKKILILLLLLLLLLLIPIVMFRCSTDYCNDSNLVPPQSQVELEQNGIADDGEAKTQPREEILYNLQKSQIQVTDKLSSYILFESGKKGSKGRWTVENVASNNVVIQCEVYLKDKLVAKTVPIKPNQHIQNISLLADIEKGTYEVTAYINYFSLDKNEYISKSAFRINMTVE